MELKETETEDSRRFMSQGSTFKESDSAKVEEEEFEQKRKKDARVNISQNKALLIGVVILIGALVSAIVIVSSNNRAKQLAEEEKRRAEELLQEIEVEVFEYSTEEKEALRLAGFTGDEIELFEFEEQDASELVTKEEEKRIALYEEEIKPYFDGASSEFKEMYENTWVGQKDVVIPKNQSGNMNYEETYNVDYEKLPSKGNQLWIKYYLSEKSICFMNVTPERYVELADSGNIVVKVRFTKLSDGTRIITSSQEIIP